MSLEFKAELISFLASHITDDLLRPGVYGAGTLPYYVDEDHPAGREINEPLPE